MNCIFCDIVKENKNILYEFNNSVVILDINPKTREHYLLISKEHTDNILGLKDLDIFQELYSFLEKNNFSDYSILINKGENSGQVIFHLHFHIMVK